MKTLKRIILIIICALVALVVINIALKLLGLHSIYYYAGYICGFLSSLFHNLFG